LELLIVLDTEPGGGPRNSGGDERGSVSEIGACTHVPFPA
jgi:hypothetical protein